MLDAMRLPFDNNSWTEPAVVMIPLSIEGAAKLAVRHGQIFQTYCLA